MGQKQTQSIRASLKRLNSEWKKDVWDCYFDILVAAGSELDHLLALGFLFTEEHVAEMVRHPLFSLEGDIPSSSLDGPLRDRVRHC
jgi:N-acyl-D-amino-acid deacylase